MTLSKDQLNAKQTILDWINSRNRRSFITLGGYAGTGKSSLIADVRKALPQRWKVAFCAYTGKASGVMKDELLAANAVNGNDYVGTIHSLCYHDEGRARNSSNIASCMKHPKVKLISHPDDDHTPLDYELLVCAARDTGTALEVNNSSLIKKDQRTNCYQNYRLMLELCVRENVPVILSSDAHDPSAVGHFELAQELLQSVGFPESLVLNTDEEKLKAFLLDH